MWKKLAASVAVAGAALAASATAASAAPAAGQVALCVENGADYSAHLVWLNRGGLSSYVISPGHCTRWLQQDVGETVAVRADYNGSEFDMGGFVGNGASKIVWAYGDVASGTQGYTIW